MEDNCLFYNNFLLYSAGYLKTCTLRLLKYIEKPRIYNLIWHIEYFRHTEMTFCVINILVIVVEGIYLGLIIYMCLSFQSHHVDRPKKLPSDESGQDSRAPVGFQNDVADVERQKSKHGPLQPQAPL